MHDTLRTALICLTLLAAYCAVGTLDYRQQTDDQQARNEYLDWHAAALAESRSAPAAAPDPLRLAGAQP